MRANWTRKLRIATVVGGTAACYYVLNNGNRNYLEAQSSSSAQPQSEALSSQHYYQNAFGTFSASHFYAKHSDLFFKLCNPEKGHRLAVRMLSMPLTVRKLLGLTEGCKDSPLLETQVWGMNFKNPVGIAAGFDKHAEAMNGLFDVGFGFVEIGSVTPLPQEGNPKPRVFRLIEDRAVINRYGFNSDGGIVVKDRIEGWNKAETIYRNTISTKGESHRLPHILGVNLGKNKTSESISDDYRQGIENFAGECDYIVINVSSPNTPGLRALQNANQLKVLLESVQQARKEVISKYGPGGKKPPILLKIAPDLTEEDKYDIAQVALENKLDGFIISNTTISRDNLVSEHKNETGGLSGVPVKDKSTALIKDMYTRTSGRIPIIGVGGIESGADAYEKIKNGASLVQLYTSFVYNGPGIVPRVKSELHDCLVRDGYSSVSQAVGANLRKKK